MISVIIPTKNRAELLSEALRSIKLQTLCSKCFEVIVVNNCSTDKTSEVVQEFKRAMDNLRIVDALEPGLHVGRHAGLIESKGDILVFADDDIEAFPTWLESVKAAFASPDVAMVGGNNIPLFVEEPPDWLLKLWEKTNKAGFRSIPALSVIEFPADSHLISPFCVWGCNFSVRKSVVVAAGGFHPDGMPQDKIQYRGDGEVHVSRYVENMGFKCVYSLGASVYHKVVPSRMTFEYFRQRGFNQGISDSYTSLRCGARSSRGSVLKNGIRPIWRRVKYLFKDSDIKKALLSMEEGYKDGHCFHQKAYLESEEVRNWVHREVYY